jgi:hypothetical protein
MADVMSSVTIAAEALKYFYLDGLVSQINENADPLTAQIEKNSQGVVGSDIVMGLQYGRHGGVGNAADDGSLPTTNPRKHAQAKWATKNLFATFQITQKLMDASKTSAGAFENMLTNEVQTLETDAKDNFSRQALGDGTGVLTTAAAGRSGASNDNLVVADTAFFAEGMLVDILDVTDGTTWLHQGIEITTVDDDSLTLIFSGTTLSATIASGDKIYIHGSKGIELTGVKAVFENTTLYGIDRTTNKWLSPKRVNLNGEIAEVDIQKGIHHVNSKAGAKTNFMLCSYGVERAYSNLLAATKQIVNSIELKGGFKAISFNGIPLTSGKYVSTGKMYLMDLADWKMYQMAEYSWMNADGEMLKWVSGKAAYQAVLYKFAKLKIGA